MKIRPITDKNKRRGDDILINSIILKNGNPESPYIGNICVQTLLSKLLQMKWCWSPVQNCSVVLDRLSRMLRLSWELIFCGSQLQKIAVSHSACKLATVLQQQDPGSQLKLSNACDCVKISAPLYYIRLYFYYYGSAATVPKIVLRQILEFEHVRLQRWH